MNSSTTDSWMIRRLAAMHAWPWLWKIAQALQAGRLLHGIEVFTLEVFNQCEEDRLLVAAIAHHGLNRIQAGRFGGSPPAFARNEFVDAVAFATD